MFVEGIYFYIVLFGVVYWFVYFLIILLIFGIIEKFDLMFVIIEEDFKVYYGQFIYFVE